MARAQLAIFGVAQRRRRLFIVGRFGRVCPAEVLFDTESGDGNFAESGEAEADIAVPLTASASESKPGRRQCDDFNLAYGIRSNERNTSQGPANIIAQAMSAKWAKGTSGPSGDEHHNLVALPITGHSGWRGEDRDTYVAGTLGSKSGGFRTTDLDGHGAYISAPVDADGVRDFTGLPEGLDSPRYRALGNAVTVQVAEWIARRILALND